MWLASALVLWLGLALGSHTESLVGHSRDHSCATVAKIFLTVVGSTVSIRWVACDACDNG
jgi:hypothetical protein